MAYEPWVKPLLEKARKDVIHFDDAEKKYFIGLIQYAIDSGNESEAEALGTLVSDINNTPHQDIDEIARYIARTFQKAGKTAVEKLVRR
ncbi:hypothetical protein C4565_06715 [Candidatus Parcubacteria bacterium]|jgi:hypothetical protein|nr:MAG: hypothetical protein C4565_06715 [Candidatus Parcubacteria bacterium]